jgi:hypothetical protein
MNFRLIYQGSLPSEQCEDANKGRRGRATEKHRLRKHFHFQLRELWKQHPELRIQSENRYVKSTTPPNQVSNPGPNVEQVVLLLESDKRPDGKSWIEHIAEDHRCCGGRFVPLVSTKGGFTCALDILFLRRDNPGHLIANGGDIDNRIKVLLDGLRMPHTANEMGGFDIDKGIEDPFFCLLEDDSLITKISVTTDRLIVPLETNENIHDVHLVIHVTMVNPAALFAGGRLV